MSEQEYKDKPGGSTTVAVLEKVRIETLKANLRGELLQPDEEGYDAAWRWRQLRRCHRIRV
jgi:hypothetical protein